MSNKARRRTDDRLKKLMSMHNEIFEQEDDGLRWYAVIVMHSVFVLFLAFMFSRYLK